MVAPLRNGAETRSTMKRAPPAETVRSSTSGSPARARPYRKSVPCLPAMKTRKVALERSRSASIRRACAAAAGVAGAARWPCLATMPPRAVCNAARGFVITLHGAGEPPGSAHHVRSDDPAPAAAVEVVLVVVPGVAVVVLVAGIRPGLRGPVL